MICRTSHIFYIPPIWHLNFQWVRCKKAISGKGYLNIPFLILFYKSMPNTSNLAFLNIKNAICSNLHSTWDIDTKVSRKNSYHCNCSSQHKIKRYWHYSRIFIIWWYLYKKEIWYSRHNLEYNLTWVWRWSTTLTL